MAITGTPAALFIRPPQVGLAVVAQLGAIGGEQGDGERMASLEAIACHLADRLAALPPLRLVSHPLGQLPVFCLELDPRVRFWSVFHLSDKLRERGWLVPA
jgi:glutamate decarboxylase